MAVTDAYTFWDDSVDAEAYAVANYDFSILDYASPSDPKLTADVTAARDKAKAEGNTKFEDVLNKILLYGDKALSILTKNGIIKNQNLVAAGYSGLDTTSATTSTDSTDTSNAPDASNRVFNIDFTSPTTLIIVFGLVLLLFYFLFFKPTSKHGKR